MAVRPLGVRASCPQPTRHRHAARGQPTSFRIKNLKQPDTCRVLMEGQVYDNWSVQDGEIEVSTEIDARSFQIIET